LPKTVAARRERGSSHLWCRKIAAAYELLRKVNLLFPFAMLIGILERLEIMVNLVQKVYFKVDLFCLKMKYFATKSKRQILFKKKLLGKYAHRAAHVGKF